MIPTTEQRAATLERVRAALGELAYEVREARDGLPAVELAAADLGTALLALRDQGAFEGNTFVSAIDHHPAEPRFEVVHQLISFSENDRLRLSVRIEGDGGAAPSVPSAAGIYPGTRFSERECYDMFGIRFEGHPDLRRLLMPEEYEHHPLRKDFPHQGIEPDKLYREWDEARRAAEEPV